MPRKSEVEALAKVLWDAYAAHKEHLYPHFPWRKLSELTREATRAMARAALVHLSKPKRGAKRGKSD